MDLLGLAVAAGHAREIFRLTRGEKLPDWATDEESFLTHFGASYNAYLEVVAHLSPEQSRMLGETLAVNPEAAVLWVLAMEEVE